jgi:hypothetical protein
MLDGEHTISASRLRRAGRETKLDVMRTWFLQHYEDPVESCPHESSEGGYQYIWGGPYDAREVLDDEFGAIVQEDLIESLASELSDISPNWSAVPKRSDLAEYEFEAITQTSESQAAFALAMKRTRSLATLSVEAKDEQTLLRLLFVSVVASLEAYLVST